MALALRAASAAYLESTAYFNELASFPITGFTNRTEASREKCRDEDELILNHLRKAIGWPKAIEELQRNLEKPGGSLPESDT